MSFKKSFPLLFTVIFFASASVVHADFVYTRTPTGSSVLNPITFRIQGVFGVDICNASASSYRLLYGTPPNPGNPNPRPSGPTFSHVAGDTVDDTWQSTLPLGTNNIVLECSNGSETNLETFTIANPAPLNNITSSPATHPHGIVGQTYHTFSMSVSGGVAPYTWSIAGGALPDGLLLDSSAGTISGTPITAGTYSFTVQASDSIGQTQTREISSLEIFPPIAVSPEGFTYARTPTGEYVTNPITFHLQGVFGVDVCTSGATGYRLQYFINPGNPGEQYGPTFSYAAGDIVDDTWQAILSVGTTYSYILLDCGNDSFTVDSLLRVVSNNPPVLAPIGNQTVTEGQTLQFTVSATDPDPGQNLTYSATNLPSGATFDPQTQTFTWIPTTEQAGSYVVTFTVTDDGSPVASAETQVTITVEEPTGTLIIRKVVVGSASTTDQFSFLVNGGPVTQWEADGENVLTLPPGTYTVTEVQRLTFIPSIDNCSNVVLEASETEICTITNTAFTPIVVSGVSTGAVEVGGTTTATGDLDGNLGSMVWNMVGGTPANWTGNFHAEIDNLEIIREGSTIYNNPFDVAPPSGPAGAGISTSGSVWTAAGGKGILDTSGSFGQFYAVNPEPSILVVGTFLTNVNPNVNAGLRSNVDFTVNGVFDLTIPDVPRKVYGLTLTDASSPNAANTAIALHVARSSVDGTVRVFFQTENQTTATRVIHGSVVLSPAPGDDQIVFHLDHVEGSRLVTASFDLLDNGVVTSSHAVPGTADIFLYHDFARVQAVANAAGTLDTVVEGTYGTIAINHGTGIWNYELGATAAQQAALDGLALGTVTSDDFTARVSFRATGHSTTQPISIQVTKPTGPTGTLIVRKVVVGGSATPDQFSFLVNGGETTQWEADGENALTLPVGTYSVTETLKTGWIPSIDNCTSVVLEEGETEICTITNTAALPTVITGGTTGSIDVTNESSTSGTLTVNRPYVNWSLVGPGAQITNRTTSYQFAIDDLLVMRNGSEYFHNTYNVAPPASDTPFGMGVSGVWTSVDGHGIMDSNLGAGNFTAFNPTPDVLITGQFLTNTNTTVNDGLRSQTEFDIVATFDLIIPDAPHKAYGLLLNDGLAPNKANEQIGMRVYQDPSDGQLHVQFDVLNSNTNTRFVAANPILVPAPGDDQIVFRLHHDAGAQTVTASYDLLDNGSVTSSVVLPGSVPVFSYHDFARVNIFSLGLGTVDWQYDGTYGRLTVNHATGAWHYDVGVTPAQQDALASLAIGESATDTFTTRAQLFGGGPFTTSLVTMEVTRSANHAPVLEPIGNKNIGEGQNLTFIVNASDVDNDTLTYSAANLPSGATFNPSTREFSWTPTFAQSGNYENIEFTVTDDGSPQELDFETITITVGDVNRPPEFDPVGSQEVLEGTSLEFAVNANDPDLDTVTLSATNLPTGAIFDTVTGEFSWTPTLSQSGVYVVTFTATDDGSPLESANLDVVITVGDDPTPTEQAEDIVDEVINDPNLPQNTENSYLANLNKVATFIENGQIQAAINQLNAFIQKVEQDYAQAIITQAQRDHFVTIAQNLINDLQ